MKDVLFTITGMNHYFGSDFLKKGMKVKLIKEPDNEYDNKLYPRYWTVES